MPRVATADRRDRVAGAVNQHRRHRVCGLLIAQARRQPASDGGQHGDLVAGFQPHPVCHDRAVGQSRHHGAIRPRAVPSGRPVDDRAKERDVIHSRLVSGRDPAAIRPAAPVAIGIGDGETPGVALLVKGGPLAHDPPAGVWMVAVQDEYQRDLASGAPGQAHRKAACPSADRQLTRD